MAVFNTFEEVEGWLSTFDSCLGETYAQPYVTFSEFAYSRPTPEDVKIQELHVANRLALKVRNYLELGAGPIYWREPFEFVRDGKFGVGGLVSQYGGDGPEIAFTEVGVDGIETTQKCWKDPNWVRVACFCRLYRQALSTAPADK